jgi:hypothetical protein
MRFVVAVVVVAVLAVLGALVLGEYEFDGTFPLVAGPLLGLVFGEAALAIARRRSLGLGAVVAALAAASLIGAGWIDSGEGLEPMKAMVWVAAGLGAVVAAVCACSLPARRATR